MDEPTSYKILVVGDAGTGKTKFIECYMDGACSSDEYVPTVGIDYKTKQVMIQGETVKLNIWDTAGESRYRTLVNAYYHGAKGFVILFNVNNEESFTSIDKFIKTCDENAPGAVKILVGTLADSPLDRVVTMDTAKEYAAENNMEYFEVNFKDGTSVDESVASMVRGIIDRENKPQTRYLEPKTEAVTEVLEQKSEDSTPMSLINNDKKNPAAATPAPNKERPRENSSQRIRSQAADNPEGGGFWNFLNQYKYILILIPVVVIAVAVRAISGSGGAETVSHSVPSSDL